MLRLRNNYFNHFSFNSTSKNTLFLFISLWLLNFTSCALKVNPSKFHGYYNKNDQKVSGKEFNFSKGTWIVFTQKTKDGRIMEYHPSEPCFVKLKVLKMATSIAYYEPNGRIIAFYENSPPMPKTTYGQKFAFTKGAAEAAKLVTNKAKKNKNILDWVNKFPAFKMYDFTMTSPFPLVQFWRKVENIQSDSYLNVPFEGSYQLSVKDLTNAYIQVSHYFNLISLFPTEANLNENAFLEVREKMGIDMNNEFYEDLYRPASTHINKKNPTHTSKNFKLVMNFFTLIAKDYVINKLYYSAFALQEGVKRQYTSLESMLDNLKLKSGSLYKNFTFSYVNRQHNLGELTQNQDQNILWKMFNVAVEVYQDAIQSYELFVKWRGKTSQGARFTFRHLKYKTYENVMARLFTIFKEKIYPNVLSNLVDEFYDRFKHTTVLKDSGFESLMGATASSSTIALFEKYLKLLGYSGFTNSDAGKLSYTAFDIFVNA